MVITNIVEIKYLKYLGVFLNLDNCYKCGSNKDIVTISFNYGGLICKECYHDEEIVDLKMIKILRNYLYIDLAKISKIGLYLQSKKFLKTIID